MTSTVRTVLAPLRAKIRPTRFPGSASYWEQRYAQGGNSGAGSYGELAGYKADFLNHFVADRKIGSVLEMGCGDGNQLSLASYPRYLGLDVSPTAIRHCVARFATDPTKSFVLNDPTTFADPANFLQAEVSLSLDVIYHLVEDEIFAAYMRSLFASARRYVIIYATDETTSVGADHVRGRQFTRWVQDNIFGWQLTDTVDNPLMNPDEVVVVRFHVYERTERDA